MIRFNGILCLMLVLASPLGAVEIPEKDRQKIEESIRQSLSVLPDWGIRLTEVKPSALKGFLEATIEFSNGTDVRKQNVYISGNYKKYIIGNLFDASEDQDRSRMEKIDVKNAPALGPETASVTIVEFSDFQCPSCKRAHDLLKEDKIMERYPDRVRLVYKNNPFPKFHNWAMPASIAAMCAYQQDSKTFWSMADHIYLHQSSITAANIWNHVAEQARRSGLDEKAFKKCFDNKESLSLIQADLAQGESLGVTQTPTYFVNGRAFVGYPGVQNLEKLIQEFIEKK